MRQDEWYAVCEPNDEGDPVYEGWVRNGETGILIEIWDYDKAYRTQMFLNKWRSAGNVIGWCWAWWQGFKMTIAEWRDR